MKKNIASIALAIFMFLSFTSNAQEKYSSTLNLGLGVGGYAGYYGYIERSVPVFTLNYELAVAENFTLAPFISFYSYSRNYYGGNNSTAYQYSETVVPIGVKGSYYFDDLLEAGSAWDFYLAGSLGFAIVNSRWDDGYDGNRNRGGRSLFLDLHIGTEYHFNEKIGAFLDLSSGVSTIGIAIH